MKKAKLSVAACVLALSLSMNALAGEMQGPGFTNPPPPPPASSLAPEPTETTVPQQNAADSITELAIEMMELFVSIY